MNTPTKKPMTEKGFTTAIKQITSKANTLAQSVHEAGLFAISQSILHGNNGFAQRLIEALGGKHDHHRVAIWLCHFGKLKIKKGDIVYRNKQDIKTEMHDVIMAKADSTPYWELTPAKKLNAKIDLLAMLNSIIHKADKFADRKQAGEQVSVEHGELLSGINKLIDSIKVEPTTKPASAQ